MGKKLKDLVQVNEGFSNAINLKMSLNKEAKIAGYIPTQASVKIMDFYLDSILMNKGQSSILIGPYGKGKSHLILIVLAILTLERNEENNGIIELLNKKIMGINDKVSEKINKIWNDKKYLSVIVSNNYIDLSQAFMLGITEALKKDGQENLIPKSYYKVATEIISMWEEDFKETAVSLKKELNNINENFANFVDKLNLYNEDALKIFQDIYPRLTAGSKFNPLIHASVEDIYKSVNNSLVKTGNYKGMFIVFDEFSKYLESSDNANPGKNMKLLQDICELSNESSKNEQMFFTMIAHKGIKEYGKYLSAETINSFLGIEGRIEERYFISKSKNNYELIKNAIIKKDCFTDYCKSIDDNYFKPEHIKEYYNLSMFKNNMDLVSFERELVKGCFPLNPLASYCLLNVSEKVAQNERTLFTFISKDEKYSLARIIDTNKDESKKIGLSEIYDYFKNIFKGDSNNTYIYTQWVKAEYALSKATSDIQKRVIKALAICNIINNFDEFAPIGSDLKLATGLNETENALNELEENQIIRKKRNGNYTFKSSINKDLTMEIARRDKLLHEDFSIVEVLNEIDEQNYFLPKQYNQDYKITRYFKHEFIDESTFNKVKNENYLFEGKKYCDGIVLSIVFDGERSSDESIKKIIDNINSDKILIITPTDEENLRELIKIYKILIDIKNDERFIDGNELLVSEIDGSLEEYKDEILAVIEKKYSLNEGAKFFYKDMTIFNETENKINKIIGCICKNIYINHPIINNELINKNVLSPAIKKARKEIIEYLLIGKDDLSFYEKTGAKDTIFRSLFAETGIDSGIVGEKFQLLFSEITKYLKNCESGKIPFDKLINKLIYAPYGVRKGVLPIYMAYVFKKKTEGIILYKKGVEVGITAEHLIDMVEDASLFEVFFSKKSAKRTKYIENLQDLFGLKSLYKINTSRHEQILISMKAWFRGLPQITRTFNNCNDLGNISSKDIVKFKKTIQKSNNPYDVVFIDFPAEFGDDLDHTFESIKLIKEYLDEYLKNIVNEIETETKKTFKGKKNLHNALIEWYSAQSDVAKKGLYGNAVTGLMSYLEKLTTYDEKEITKKIAKIVTGNYIENWNDEILANYTENLKLIKEKIEGLQEKNTFEGKKSVAYINSDGEKIIKYYTEVEDDNGIILEQTIEDALDDFYDLSVNDKAAILVKMLDKVLEGK